MPPSLALLLVANHFAIYSDSEHRYYNTVKNMLCLLYMAKAH